MCQAGTSWSWAAATHLTQRGQQAPPAPYFVARGATAQRTASAQRGIPVPGATSRPGLVPRWHDMWTSRPVYPTEIAYFDRGLIDLPNDTTNANPRRATRSRIMGRLFGTEHLPSSRPWVRRPGLGRAAAVGERDRRGQAGAMKEYNPQSQPKLVWPRHSSWCACISTSWVRNNGLSH